MAKQNQRRPNTPPQRRQNPQQPAQQGQVQNQPRKTAPAAARRSEPKGNWFTNPEDRTLLYSRQHFIIMGAGLLLVIIGLALMAGGAMPDPNVWEPERIYSFRRITLAPIAMVAGFVVVIFGIFKKNPAVDTTPTPVAADNSDASE